MKMKKITITFFFAAISAVVFGQSFQYSMDVEADTMQAEPVLGTHVDYKGHLYNLTNAALPTQWYVENVNFPDPTWQFYVCDANSCYDAGVASQSQTTGANDTSLLKPTIVAGKAGVGSMTVRVVNLNNTSEEASYNFTLDATFTGTNRLASVVVFSQNAPNPFDNYTVVRYDLKGNDGRILVTDVAGRQVSEYALNANDGQVEIGADLQSGLYFYSLVVDGHVVMTKRLQKL